MTSDELRRIPKVELHRHLELSWRLSTLKELAQLVGLPVPASESELKKQWLITEPMKDLESVLKKFLLTQSVLSSEEILTRITYEAIEDAYNEGVRILELRYAPTYIRQGQPKLNFERIHRAIMKGVEKAKHLPIAVGIIAIIQRTLPLSDAEEVTEFAIAHKGEILALDLADNEAGFEPSPFAPLFERARSAGLHITVHSGEANIPESPNFVRDTIEKLGAERIGHGVQIWKSMEVMEFVYSRQVPLELCPTSNWLTNAVPSLEEHPFRKLFESGLLVTINSDDPGIFDTDLVKEYQILHEKQGITEGQFNRINDIAASASFIPFELKQKFWPRPIDRTLAPMSNR